MLEISRDNISGLELTKFKEIDRFIKLPVESYLDLLDVTPNSSQTALINAANNPDYRFIVAALSRRQGKTYIANIIGQLISLVPNSNVLIMSPNYSLSQISFDLQRSLIKHFDLEVLRDNAKDKIIELSNHSTIRMGSVNQVDSVVGRSYDLIIFDEAALSEGMDAFNVALRPTLDKPGSKAIFISTPRGRNNWFSKLYNRGFSDDHPNWISIKATYHENPRITMADIEEARKAMSTAEFSQEYLADFNQFEGQVWTFDQEKYVADLRELDLSKMDVIAGLDVGFRDPTAFVVIAYSWEDEKYYLVDEYLHAERTTDQHAVFLRKLIDKYDVDLIYIDSAAQQVRFDLAQEHDIPTNNATKDVLAGIAHVASIVENGRLIVDQRCVQTLITLDQYQWDPNRNLLKEKPVHNDASHIADALRYALYTFQDSEITV
jgi:PBSX family phage terminase large subunit